MGSPHPQLPATGVLQPLLFPQNKGNEDQTKKGSKMSSGSLPELASDMFHVFTWSEKSEAQALSSTEFNIDNIMEQLAEADKYLTKSTSWSQQKAYEAGSVSSHADVYAYLVAKERELDELSGKDSTKRDDWTAAVDLYNAAEIVFHLFLPWRFRGDAPTLGKFWGAIEDLVKVC